MKDNSVPFNQGFMKLRTPILLGLVGVGIFALAASWSRRSDADKESLLFQALVNGLEQLHYQPVAINDDFSKKAYKLYLHRLDGGKRWLTQPDIAQLKKYELLIDDEAKEGKFGFFNITLDLINNSITKTQGYYRDILSKPFDFKASEELELDGDKRDWAKNDQELRQYWHQMLKYETLTRVADKLEEQEKLNKEKPDQASAVKDDPMAGTPKKTVAELEEEARKDILKQFDDWYKRMAKYNRTDRLNDYLNAITNVFDPHTNYYEPKEKEAFDISMSGSLEGIGARLTNEGDYTKITEIIPGGPAWKGKELEEGDLVVKVAQGAAEPVDITGYRVDDVVKLIRGKKGTEVRLTVKKKDNTTKIIRIIREIVIMEEGFAKSMIINLPGTIENVGYIKLPRFYADFNGISGRNCADDVAKEVERLKRLNVKGIILDLRNNGGGSLRDVVKMSGLFIESGPIVQVKARDRKPEVLYDTDPTVQYRGAFVVMVNEYSASASEILAAAMQDYGRAIVVGSRATFGKGTVQRFIDLDDGLPPAMDDLKPLGEVKLTIQKFYRVNGGSTQLKGVVPDIVLPDRYHYLKTGEAEQEYPLAWTEIASVPYQQNVWKPKDLKSLVAASEKRQMQNAAFKTVQEEARRLKEDQDHSKEQLSLEKYRTELRKRKQANERYEDLFKENEFLAVLNLEEDKAAMASDESGKARNEEMIKALRKDFYLVETLNILADALK